MKIPRNSHDAPWSETEGLGQNFSAHCDPEHGNLAQVKHDAKHTQV